MVRRKNKQVTEEALSTPMTQLSTCDTATTSHQSAPPQVNAGQKVLISCTAISDSKSQKWTALEHSGVTFFPRYEPHGVKLVFKNKQIKVSPEVEEVCNWWA